MEWQCCNLLLVLQLSNLFTPHCYLTHSHQVSSQSTPLRATVRMDSLTVMKKVRKLSRKGKLLSGNSGLDEKQEMLTALMNKTGKSYKVGFP